MSIIKTYQACEHCGLIFGVETTSSRRGLCFNCLQARLVEAYEELQKAQTEVKYRTGALRTKFVRRASKWQGELDRLKALEEVR